MTDLPPTTNQKPICFSVSISSSKGFLNLRLMAETTSSSRSRAIYSASRSRTMSSAASTGSEDGRADEQPGRNRGRQVKIEDQRLAQQLGKVGEHNGCEHRAGLITADVHRCSPQMSSQNSTHP